MFIGDDFPEGKTAGAWIPSSCEFKNAWIPTSTSPCIFMARTATNAPHTSCHDGLRESVNTDICVEGDDRGLRIKRM
jgi:hypothetical protein